MKPAIYPERLLAVADAERLVVLERARSITGLVPVDRQVALIGSQDRLLVVVDQANALALGRSLHQGQRHGRLKNLARFDHVVEEQAGLGLLP